MLRFEDVSFRYPHSDSSVEHLSFHIQKGEFVALIGSNGAGKSTISRLSNGLLKPDSGTVYLDGTPTTSIRTSQIARKAGFLFQNPDRQICQNTVQEELAFGLRLMGLTEQEIRERTREAIEQFSLDGDWFPFSRSRGERQRIALASVLVCRPQLVILDEPTTGLDYRECTAIMDYLTRLNREEGLTVLMVSHDMELVSQYAGRVLVLTGGQLIGDGATHDVMRDQPLLGRAHVLPAQIPALALKLGAGAKQPQFEDVFTVEEMFETICRLRKEMSATAGKGEVLS